MSVIMLQVIRVLGLLGALDPHKHKVRKGRTLRNTMGMPISKPMDKGSKGTGSMFIITMMMTFKLHTFVLLLLAFAIET